MSFRDADADWEIIYAATLSPINDDIEAQKEAKLALDALQLALFVSMAPTFHGLLERAKWWRSNPNWAGSG